MKLMEKKIQLNSTITLNNSLPFHPAVIDQRVISGI